MLIERLASALAGPIGPLLCRVAVAETLKALPADALGGAVTATLVVLTSVLVLMPVVLLPLALLSPAAGSATCSWSIAPEAVTEKEWLDGSVQVTDQTIGPPGTVVAVDVASRVSCAVCGLADDVVQSAGSVSVNVVSTFVGPYGPLLWTVADAVTLNGEPAAFEEGLFTVTLVTLMSDVESMTVVLLPLPLLLPLFGSLTCN